ncbi:hypothetical protein G9A89_008998 [Geosiphon pyriformis]|nr:hypothetical protein G9A89_008998 [Geosiphon pyriformis]
MESEVNNDISSVQTEDTLSHPKLEEATQTNNNVNMEDIYVKEKDVGITEYLNPKLPGFSGVLKQLHSDFLVNEINLNGTVHHLTSFAVQTDSIEPHYHRRGQPRLPQTHIKSRLPVFDQKTLDEIQNLIDSKGIDSEPVITEKPIHDKDKRKAIHQFIREYFGDILFGETMPDQSISIQMINRTESRPTKERDMGLTNKDAGTDIKYRKISKKTSITRWEKGRGNYCEFLLLKENRDTISAINLLSRLLRVHNRVFSYAGTKDTRAVTVQRVAAHRIFANRLAGLNNRLVGMRLGNFKYVSEPMKLGELKGNRFQITIRQVQIPSQEELLKSIISLKDYGFINYYGMQRFGTSTIPTWKIGLALLQNNWEEAVDLILRPRVGEYGKIKDARAHWAKTRNPQETLEMMPDRYYAEMNILKTFIKNGNTNNYLEAFNSIPNTLRSMYCHAYQSYIWNRVVSERINKFGCKSPLIGDLVVSEEDAWLKEEELSVDLTFIPLNEESTLESETKFSEGPSESSIRTSHLDSVSPEIQQNTADESKKVRPRGEGLGSGINEKITILDNVNIKNYTINDVVYPGPGHAIKYPQNEIFELYKKFMGEDGLDPTKMERIIREFSLPGSYRKIIGRPWDLDWSLFQYNDPCIPLAVTDADILKGTAEIPRISDGKYLACQISFNLLSGQYATMVLREIMRQETSSGAQYELQKKGQLL